MANFIYSITATSGFGDNRAEYSNSNQKINANLIYQYLLRCGWKHNPICAVIGNAQVESYLNPAQWQSTVDGWSLTASGNAVGLLQWDSPNTKLLLNGLTINNYFDGNGQLAWLNDYTDVYVQWIDRVGYGTFAQFKTDITNTSSYLAYVFARNWEGSTTAQDALRMSNATWWSSFLTGKENMPLYLKVRPKKYYERRY